MMKAPESAAGALRIFSQDCFVEGCDASVIKQHCKIRKGCRNKPVFIWKCFLLAIFLAKKAVESHCPRVVTCADVLAIVTRDSYNEPLRFEVQMGRRDGPDGLVSEASRVAGNILHANDSLSSNLTLPIQRVIYPRHGSPLGRCLSLLGVMSRIYSCSLSFDVDPNMNQNHAKEFRETFPEENFDPTKGFGLLGTDRLASDPRTQVYVNLMANYQELFYSHFITATIRLGITGVKTGNEGEIRQDCGSFNNNSVYSIANKQTMYGFVL
ncbi:hypothetical protein BDE02_05G074400 [Populus trichocarpa]|nr:hypothetical protein BDE02_05G074400 [Populus trichocarpa]